MVIHSQGLINAIQKLAPNAEHRHCSRHVYENFRKKWSGRKYKQLFWDCVNASTPAQYQTCLQNLKSESVEAWNDFCKRNPKSFCKSLISSYTKTDMIENNICECFNSSILKARDKPILHMLEDIRSNIMRNHHDLAEKIQKCTDEICPKVRKKIYEVERWTKFCNIRGASRRKYEVHCSKDGYIVDLLAKTCNCRAWELTGIPCCHALACINYLRADVILYVDPFFLKSNAVELYNHGLQPIHGEQDWPTDDMPAILPPKVHKRPGRPKKQLHKR